jgi:NADH-quinone oxidoreductase subunit N
MNTILSLVDVASLYPLSILLVGALLILLLESFDEESSKKYSFYVALITLAAALYAAIVAPVSQNPLLTPWLSFDSLGRLFTIFFLVIGLASTLLSSSFFQSFESSHGEYFFLLLSAVFGLILIGSAADFLTLFLGLETLSISLYVLCGYMKRWEISHESSIKYFLIGSMAAAFLLYGIALIYGATGTTRLDALLNAYRSLTTASEQILFLSGIAFVTIGLAFKAAIVPFHVWAPDVYDGAPTPVTAFMAVGTKVGAFAALARVFLVALPEFNTIWNQAIALLAIPTLIYANIVALRQMQLRRFFAYSGISHAGFMLMPLAAGTSEAVPALVFYLIVYALATLGAFAVLAFLDRDVDGVLLRDLRGLFWRSPLLAGILTLCLLTLIGLPPTAGFLAKFYVLKLAFQAGYYPLVIVGLLTAILAGYYYLRIIALMFSEAPAETEVLPQFWSAGTVGLISFAALLLLACFPAPLLNLIAAMSKV